MEEQIKLLNDLVKELYFKLELIIYIWIELSNCKKDNESIISIYMQYRLRQKLSIQDFNPSNDLLIGRQKGCFIYAVLEYLAINLSEVYRVVESM